METNANVLTPEENNSPKTEANTNETPKMKIDLEPIKFESDAETIYLNGTQLREKIDAMFKAVFADYIGCRLNINNPGVALPEVISRTLAPNALYVDLVFAENAADGYHVLKRRSDTKGSKIMSRLNYVMGGMSNRMYVLDDGAMEALEEFLPQVSKNKKPDFYQRTVEITNPSSIGIYGYNGGSMTEVSVIGFPVEVMIEKIFGSKDDEGHELKYGCHLIRSTVDGRDLVLQVTQLKTSTVTKLFNIMGMGQQFGNPFMSGFVR